MANNDLSRLSVPELEQHAAVMQSLADEGQREAARLQRAADRARKEIKRRRLSVAETNTNPPQGELHEQCA
ncbi:hypothetical protein [Pseudoxanthomonas dokdonensis]|uniref:Uncharacterized protein n=1 Tax=Pseudoxanthomonas dokdonensis TaxID=344882 RepID=A0A0R0CTA8_9GAMM|nr:hypothetical protein [Pseudoxanthomonas dokdonensis]KRG69134.1 hypothetical protein ABB29_12055 [Pseudoxanthomonas dokdonensis]